jgi:transposase
MGHDGWKPYDFFEKARHQQCLSHLLNRCGNLLLEATRGAVRFPRKAEMILQDALSLRDRRDEKTISPHGVRVATGRLSARLDRLTARRFTHPGNRRLARFLLRHRDSIFTFLKVPGIEAANWKAEQAIRPAVVNRKVWGGNRTPWGAHVQERVISVIRTCYQQRLEPLVFLSRTLRAHPDHVPRLLSP